MKNIVLVGFMGTGKSSIGRLLATRLRRPFIDTDRKIEREACLTIPEIFAQYGESGFRSREAAVIARVARYTNVIIATGGGAVLLTENVSRLKTNGIIVALTASPEVILERTSRRNNRPLLNQVDRKNLIVKLLSEREPFYAVADFTIDTSHITPHQVADKIVTYMREEGYLRGRA